MNKIYQATENLELHTNVLHKDKKIRISFVGGSTSPRRVNGKFGTCDPDLQETLENDSGFNKTFILLEAIIDKNNTKVIVDKSDYETVDEVDSVQSAKEYLLARFTDEFSANQLRSRVMINEALERKKLHFPNM